MTVIGSDSPSILLRAILEQHPRADFDNHLDALLIWLNKGGPDSELTARLELQGIALDIALQRALMIIDQYLFTASATPYAILGLSADANDKTIRLRYRRLIQAFHPDRQPDHQQWLTERTEQLNIAYRAIKNKEPALSEQASKPARSKRYKSRAAKYQAATSSVHTEAPVNSNLAFRLRSVLGAGHSFELRFFIVLFTICILLLSYLYYINKPSMRRLTEQNNLTVIKPSEIDQQLLATQASPPIAQALAATGYSDSQENISINLTKETFYKDKIITGSVGSGKPNSAIMMTGFGKKTKRSGETGAVKPSPDRITPLKQLAPESRAPSTRLQFSEVAIVQSKPSTPDRPIPQPIKSLACEGLQLFLRHYIAHYNRGDSHAYLALYSQDATENQLQGYAHIQKMYQHWFNQTKQRELQIRQLTVRPIRVNRCLVQGQYSVSYKKVNNGERVFKNGKIEFLLKQKGHSYQIVSLRY